MSMGLRLIRCLVPVALAIVLDAGLPKSANAAPRNVLVFVADDLGTTLGCYGDANAKTPRIDAFADGATRFTRAHCTTASCSASRSVILSGYQNHFTGQYGLAHADHHFRSQEKLQTLPVRMSAAGYRTACFGKFHVEPEVVYHFDQYPKIVGGMRSPDGFATAVKTFVDEKDDRPFFAYVCSIDPHRAGSKGYANDAKHPGDPQVEFDPKALKVPSFLPDREETRADLADYYQAVARLDATFGKVLDVLKAQGKLDDTLILFLSDNGIPFPGAKTTQYEPGLNLPLIVRVPNQKAAVVNQALVTWADLTPTILDYAGVDPVPLKLHGKSFLKILDQTDPAGWDEIFTSHTFHEVTMYYPMRTLRTPRYKLILNVAHPLPFPFASDLHGSPTWQAALAHPDEKYGLRTIEQYVQRPQYELYDLENDPGEIHNLAGETAHAETLKSMQAKLKERQQQTADPWIIKYQHE